MGGSKISSRHGSICVGSVPLSKANDPDTHYNLCPQEANYAPILPQSAPRHDTERQNPHSNPLCCSTVRFGSNNRPQRCRNAPAPRSAYFGSGFSLILGLVQRLLSSASSGEISCRPGTGKLSSEQACLPQRVGDGSQALAR